MSRERDHTPWPIHKLAGRPFGARSSWHAARLVNDLLSFTPTTSLRKSFHPDDPTRVLSGERPTYTNREVLPGDEAAFIDAAQRMVAAFEEAEGRGPTDADSEFMAAMVELFNRHFPEPTEGRGGWTAQPVQKRGGLVSSAILKFMRGPGPGRRVVMGDGVPEPVSKSAAASYRFFNDMNGGS